MQGAKNTAMKKSKIEKNKQPTFYYQDYPIYCLYIPYNSYNTTDSVEK